MNIKKEVIKSITEISFAEGYLPVGLSQIELSHNLEDDLGVGEFELVDILSDLEDKFEVSFDDNEISDFKTVGDIINFIKKAVK